MSYQGQVWLITMIVFRLKESHFCFEYFPSIFWPAKILPLPWLPNLVTKLATRAIGTLNDTNKRAYSHIHSSILINYLILVMAFQTCICHRRILVTIEISFLKQDLEQMFQWTSCSTFFYASLWIRHHVKKPKTLAVMIM